MTTNPVADIIRDVARTNWLPHLNSVTVSSFKSIEDWLSKGNYVWHPSPQGSALLEVVGDQKDLAQAYASEISRFSCASYETLLDINSNKRSMGWQLIQQYYSAFFCAHALLRVNGTAITFLSDKTCTLLNKLGATYLSFSPKLSSGVYQIEYSRAPNPTLKIIKPSSSSGSHVEMWTVLLNYLNNLENSIILNFGTHTPAMTAVSFLQSISNVLTQSPYSHGGWASSFRSAVNYRHEHYVWYPHTKPSNYYAEITDSLRLWAPNNKQFMQPLLRKDDVTKFIFVCNSLNHILTSILDDISKRSPKPRYSFVDRKPFRILRENKIM